MQTWPEHENLGKKELGGCLDTGGTEGGGMRHCFPRRPQVSADLTPREQLQVALAVVNFDIDGIVVGGGQSWMGLWARKADAGGGGATFTRQKMK